MPYTPAVEFLSKCEQNLSNYQTKIFTNIIYYLNTLYKTKYSELFVRYDSMAIDFLCHVSFTMEIGYFFYYYRIV